MSLTPVLLFTYDRLDQLRQTVSSLQRNIYAEDTELFIFSDTSKEQPTNNKVRDVRAYIKSLSGFKTINIIERNENYGLAKNIIQGVSDIIEEYERVIVLEDDLVTSNNFLCYMNRALEFYEDKESIFSIAGYSPQLNALKNYSKDTYLFFRPSSWGWASWGNRWYTIDWEVSDFNDFIKDKSAIQKFNRGGADLTRFLKASIEGKINSWAVRWCYAMFRQNKYCVYPRTSKIQNDGFGNTATHCKTGANVWTTQLDSSSKDSFDFSIETYPSPSIAKEFHYQYSYKNKFIKKIYSFLDKSVST
jgi:hypothetical protein